MKVSVIIANRNDIEMLAVTVRSAIEEISAVPGGGEVVIVDNSDADRWEAVQSVIPMRYKASGIVRLYRQDFPCLFSAREEAARKAKGDFIFCVDSHCLIGHNVIIDLVHFMNRNKSRPVGFAHAPVNWLCQHETAAKHDMKEIYGTWGRLYQKERKITWKGMPWMCGRDWFVNKMNGYGHLAANKMSWGGGDMYLGIKSWLLGFENWAVPTRPVIHIGPLPVKARKFHAYRLYSQSGDHAVSIGFLSSVYALGADRLLDDKGFTKFLEDRFAIKTQRHGQLAYLLAENDRKWVEQNRKVSFDDLVERRPWDV